MERIVDRANEFVTSAHELMINSKDMTFAFTFGLVIVLIF
jgi:hypothetical protein